MKKFFLTLILFTNCFAVQPPSDKARGVFLAFGVGPRIPIFEFSKNTVLGYGFNLEISYTDNEYLPIFLFGKIGFEQYPGSQDFYQTSEYSHFSTALLPMSLGGRYYFAPLLENVVLLIPYLEAAANFTVYKTINQFKSNANKNDFSNDGMKYGFSLGAGASMFLMEILASYNYLNSNQFLSFDLKVRIPLYVSL